MQASLLGDWLSELSVLHAHRAAVIGDSRPWSFAELDARASVWARALRRCGHGPGSHIGLLAGNGPQWLAAAFGVWRSGATLVPISTFVTPRELGDLLEHADVELLITQPQIGHHSYADALARVSSLPRLQRIIALDEADHPLEARPAGRLEDGASANDPESIACILYTSGTTGRAKGVRLSHRAILATVRPTATRTGLQPGDSLLSTLPLFWVAGLVIRALPTLATGCSLILPELFSADTTLELLERHRPTALHLRPPQVGQILGHPDFRPELLAAVHRGGGRAAWYAPYLSEARLITGYGMTEMAGYVTALCSTAPATELHEGLGAPLPGVEIRILGSDGIPCPAGASGEIQVRGPGLFSGYHKESPGYGYTEDGWFATGDLGAVDPDGRFHFSGRSKDLLRVKGINVSPVEVETILAQHPAVEAAYVVGLPEAALDQQVVAIIVAKHPVDVAQLQEHAASELSHYKRPTRYVFTTRSAIPLGGTSKPQRQALTQLAVQAIQDPS